ncbi:MAG: hypothetical protein WD059_12955 [Balneolaceae bacterium]
MKPLTISTILAFLILTAFSIDTAAQETQAHEDHQHASEIIEDWPETAKKTAKEVIDTYGEPDEMTSSLLVWNETEDWNKTMIQREEIDHEFPMPHKDVLYQEIDYDVPTEYFDVLAVYDGSVIVERTKGTIAARCDKEAANYLAINLAHEIIEDEKSVEEAREFYAQTMKKMMEGETSEYVQGFIFDVSQGDTGDADSAIMDE